MSEIVSQRREIVFLYDVKDINPNGDPLDENKPRIDDETMVNLVSDVRLKRTVRDYLHNFKGMEVFIRETKKEDGTLIDKEGRLSNLNVTSADELLNKCVDIRLFGATAAIPGKSIILTGPVQFRFGRSLHRVKVNFIKGTTVMPSAEKKKQGTFTEQYILPYSLIGFYGIVNENAARSTQLTDDDIALLYDGLWNGTKNLISRSKVGQMPRLLLSVVYKEKNYHIGDLNGTIKLVSGKDDEEIRDVSEFNLDVTDLVAALTDNKGKIQRVELIEDPRLTCVAGGEQESLQKLITAAGVKVTLLVL
ncbi:MAG: type I-B CRISPR-associated protein Cas7/Csh2 [Candidatus Methanomethylophilaceae archaeon]|nr:type I-B CRISPR-associated protein Cas7/Csh2 [Candidatus Methanomethylophilaceae archaeon]